MEGAWSFVSPQRKPVAGDGWTYPSVRYSACSVAYDRQLIVTHGYHYNHDERHPAWKSDAWSFSFGTKKWRKVHEGEDAGAPSARYSASCVLWNHAMYMYGGDDGGHKYSMNNYVFGAHFSEMWRLDLRSFTWQKVKYASSAPPKRALHAAVVIDNSMYVYGGLELSDTWRFDFLSLKWELLVPMQTSKSKTHPGRRHALAAAAGDGCFYLFGGGQHGHGFKPRAFNDLFKFSLATNSWSKVKPVGDSLPAPRSHHSLLSLSPSAILLYGGALCTPGCKCHGDTWVFDTTTSEWNQINASNAPVHRYRQSLVLDETDGALYLFGGESYRPYMYHNAVNKLVLSGPKLAKLVQPSAFKPSTVTPRLDAAPNQPTVTNSSPPAESNTTMIVGIALLVAFVAAAVRWMCKPAKKEYHPLERLAG